MPYKKTLLFCLLILLCYGCSKNGAESDNLSLKEQVNIYGTVLLNDGSPAANVLVNIDGNHEVTDKDGFFNFTGNISNTDKTVIKFSKSGYFDYYKTLVVEKGASYGIVNHHLIKRSAIGTVSASTGGVVKNEYATLTFLAGGIVKANGAEYTGTATVNFSYTDPIRTELPGDMRGVDRNNNPVAIEPYGGFIVEIIGQAGEILKLSKPMQFNYKILMRGPRPESTMNLWSYNVADAIWVENGSVEDKKSGISGSTTSLEFLQFAKPYPRALLKAVITNGGNIPAGFKFENRYNPEENYMRGHTTVVNSKGVALVYVPANTPGYSLLLAPCWDELVGNASIPAIAPGKTSVQTLNFDFSKFSSNIRGVIEECGFTGFNGFAELKTNVNTYRTQVVNGKYKFNVLNCGLSYGFLSVFDKSNNLLSKKEVPITITKDFEAAAVNLCKRPLTGSVTVTAEGQTYTFSTPKDSIGFGQAGSVNFTFPATAVWAVSADGTKRFSFSCATNTLGTVNLISCIFGIPGKNYFMTWGIYSPGQANFIKYKSGEIAAEGTFKSNTNINFDPYSGPEQEREITGTFNIRQ